MQLGAIREPWAGDAAFGLYVSQAAPRSVGWLALGLRTSGATFVGGASILLDLARRIVRRAFTTDADGLALIDLPLTALPTNARFDAQVLVRATSACGGVARCASSNGLGIHVR